MNENNINWNDWDVEENNNDIIINGIKIQVQELQYNYYKDYNSYINNLPAHLNFLLMGGFIQQDEETSTKTVF